MQRRFRRLWLAPVDMGGCEGCVDWLGRAIGSGCRGEDAAVVIRDMINASLSCITRSTNLMRAFGVLVGGSPGSEGERGSCQKETLGATYGVNVVQVVVLMGKYT